MIALFLGYLKVIFILYSLCISVHALIVFFIKFLKYFFNILIIFLDLLTLPVALDLKILSHKQNRAEVKTKSTILKF